MKEERIDNILVIITCTIASIILIAFIFMIIDFKNDYDCSTTTDPEWYVEHNCMRYERWGYNE